MKTALIVIASVGIGVIGGRLWPTADAPAPLDWQALLDAHEERVVARISAHVDARARALAVAPAERLPPACEPVRLAPEEKPREVEDAHVETAQAEALIDQALNRASWGDDETQTLRGLVSSLPAADRDRLMRKLAVAINSGKLRVTTQGSPF